MRGPIGVFDSGYGGLTVLNHIQSALPQHEFIYLGDNARAPYGTKSFEDIYRYTRECVAYLFNQDCPLVILACNTASARALRHIQQRDLLSIQRYPLQRVLGVIRPTAETIGNYTRSRHVGILGTTGTIKSQSYRIEINRFYPDIRVHQHACPNWVTYIESGEYNSENSRLCIEADVNKLMKMSEDIDCILLACTHYPLIAHHIRPILPESVILISQGRLVADSTADYINRQRIIGNACTRSESSQPIINYLTTGDTSDFIKHASLFCEAEITARRVSVL